MQPVILSKSNDDAKATSTTTITETIEQIKEWISEASVPTRCFKALVINSTQFITINTNDTWLYDNNTHTWDYYKPRYVHPGANDCCMDYETKTLWLINDDSIIKIKNDHASVYRISWGMDTSVGSSMRIIDSSLHIIGGSDNTKHIKLDRYLKPRCLHDFRRKRYWQNGNYYHGLVHIKSADQLLLFGGFELGPRGRSNEIMRYSLKRNEWKKLDSKLSTELNAFGYIITNDEKQVVIFGGNTDYYMSYDIFILSLDTMLTRKSQIQCPDTESTGFNAMLLLESHFDELFVNAYLETKSYIVPKDIISMILKLASTHYVHLITLCNSKHWKIPLDVLLVSIKLETKKKD